MAPISATSPVQLTPAEQQQPSKQASKVQQILDIRRSKDDWDLKEEIFSKLKPSAKGGEKRMPTILLYDEKGLKLFEDITYLDEYYLTNAEIEVLQTWSIDIARQIKPGSMVVELGSGNLRKTGILLDALDKIGQPFHYHALDLSLPELERTLGQVPSYKNVTTTGLHGTYDDGLEWLKSPANKSKPKCIMSLGSSIGNFTREEAFSFLKGFADILNPANDSLLVGIDGCQDGDAVWHAYNDRDGTTEKFIMNGLVHANQVLGVEAFKAEDWKYVGEYDADAGRHQAFYYANKDLVYEGIEIKQGEKVRVEESYKYSAQHREELWEKAGLTEYVTWGARSARNPYYIHMAVPRNA